MLLASSLFQQVVGAPQSSNDIKSDICPKAVIRVITAIFLKDRDATPKELDVWGVGQTLKRLSAF